VQKKTLNGGLCEITSLLYFCASKITLKWWERSACQSKWGVRREPFKVETNAIPLNIPTLVLTVWPFDSLILPLYYCRNQLLWGNLRVQYVIWARRESEEFQKRVLFYCTVRLVLPSGQHGSHINMLVSNIAVIVPVGFRHTLTHTTCTGWLLKLKILYWHIWFNEEPFTYTLKNKVSLLASLISNQRFQKWGFAVNNHFWFLKEPFSQQVLKEMWRKNVNNPKNLFARFVQWKGSVKCSSWKH